MIKKICSSFWVVVGDKKESVANAEKMILKWGAHETISGKRNTNSVIWKETFFRYVSQADANMKKKLKYFIYGCKKHRKFRELYKLPKFHAKLENMP